uniref:Family with sequence similarity 227 member A n=1 Tax=Pelodiscus sinensis TaxID=13735 RepID=K7F8X1_PELSI
TLEKNKLVELYQYPGFNEHEPTPLPNGMELADIIEKVVHAQRKSASGKVLCILTKSSKMMLQKFLTAPVSHAILLDSFWWFFLHLYQPDKKIQGRLFDRIAKNYAALLFDCHKFSNHKALIKVFPSLLSQTLYTCFCSSFPRSWFNTHEFKSQLCNVLSEWMAGTLPVPGSYSSWDYSLLEPERCRREDLLSTKGKQRKGENTDEIASPMSQEVMWAEPSLSQREFHASGSPEKTPQLPTQSYKVNSILFMKMCNKTIIASCLTAQPKEKPPQETKKRDEVSACFQMFPVQSHPACQGPDFTWHLFNINGHSPLIQHFLQSYKLEPQSGQDIFIHRREFTFQITESTPTYADVIQQGFNHIRQLDKAFKTVYQRHRREIKDFDQHQLKEKQEFLRKEKQLLSEKGEMKKLNQMLTP